MALQLVKLYLLKYNKLHHIASDIVHHDFQSSAKNVYMFPESIFLAYAYSINKF